MIADIAKMSVRGQVAIPSEMREALNLTDGDRLLFLLEEDSIIIKKVTSKTFLKLSEPLRKMKKNLKEEDVPGLVHGFRNSRRH